MEDTESGTSKEALVNLYNSSINSASDNDRTVSTSKPGSILIQNSNTAEFMGFGGALSQSYKDNSFSYMTKVMETSRSFCGHDSVPLESPH